MDVFLAIASKRDTRTYAQRPVPRDLQNRILDAGRLAGSARNRQPWTFVVVEDRDTLAALAKTVYVPSNVEGAAFAVAIVGRSGLDAGRAAQNMMLAAWDEGVVSTPNGMPEPAEAVNILGLGDGEEPITVLSFGYSVEGRDPARHSAEEWSERADRKSLGEVVRRL